MLKGYKTKQKVIRQTDKNINKLRRLEYQKELDEDEKTGIDSKDR